MRFIAWLCIFAGVLISVFAFFYTVRNPTVRPWPGIAIGFSVTMLGIILFAIW